MDDAKKTLANSLKEANNVLISITSNPDVDQLAAAIGLTLILNRLGKHATTVFSGTVPPLVSFLHPEKIFEKNTDSLRDFIISLDKAKADKLRYKIEDEYVKIYITPYQTAIGEKDLIFSQGDFNVDVVVGLGVHNREELDQAITAHGRILHDATVTTINAGDISDLGSINWADNTSSSICEMIVGLTDLLAKQGLLDTQISNALLTGIVAETQRFSNKKTTAATMSASSKLLACGANQQLVAAKLAPKPVKRPAPTLTPMVENVSHDVSVPSQIASPEEVKDNSDFGVLEVAHSPEELLKIKEGEPEEASDLSEVSINDEGDLKVVDPNSTTEKPAKPKESVSKPEESAPEQPAPPQEPPISFPTPGSTDQSAAPAFSEPTAESTDEEKPEEPPQDNNPPASFPDASSSFPTPGSPDQPESSQITEEQIQEQPEEASQSFIEEPSFPDSSTFPTPEVADQAASTPPSETPAEAPVESQTEQQPEESNQITAESAEPAPAEVTPPESAPTSDQTTESTTSPGVEQSIETPAEAPVEPPVEPTSEASVEAPVEPTAETTEEPTSSTTTEESGASNTEASTYTPPPLIPIPSDAEIAAEEAEKAEEQAKAEAAAKAEEEAKAEAEATAEEETQASTAESTESDSLGVKPPEQTSDDSTSDTEVSSAPTYTPPPLIPIPSDAQAAAAAAEKPAEEVPVASTNNAAPITPTEQPAAPTETTAPIVSTEQPVTQSSQDVLSSPSPIVSPSPLPPAGPTGDLTTLSPLSPPNQDASTTLAPRPTLSMPAGPASESTLPTINDSTLGNPEDQIGTTRNIMEPPPSDSQLNSGNEFGVSMEPEEVSSGSLGESAIPANSDIPMLSHDGLAATGQPDPNQSAPLGVPLPPPPSSNNEVPITPPLPMPPATGSAISYPNMSNLAEVRSAVDNALAGNPAPTAANQAIVPQPASPLPPVGPAADSTLAPNPLGASPIPPPIPPPIVPMNNTAPPLA